MGPKFVIVQGLKKEVLNGPKGKTFHLVIKLFIDIINKIIANNITFTYSTRRKKLRKYIFLSNLSSQKNVLFVF